MSSSDGRSSDGRSSDGHDNVVSITEANLSEETRELLRYLDAGLRTALADEAGIRNLEVQPLANHGIRVVASVGHEFSNVDVDPSALAQMSSETVLGAIVGQLREFLRAERLRPAFLTIDKPGGWRPSHDFVYFRPIDKEARTRGGIIIPNFGYAQNELPNGGRRNGNRAEESKMLLCECLAVGPGRLLPNGALRLAPCKAGDIFSLDQKVSQGAVVTNIIDDDGRPTMVVEGAFVIGVRSDMPPWAREMKSAAPELVVPEVAAPQVLS